MRSRPATVFVAMLAAALGALAAGSARAADGDIPEGPGKAETVEACSTCHGLELLADRPRSADEWAQAIDAMIGYGAVITEEQKKLVLDYLTASYGAPGG